MPVQILLGTVASDVQARTEAQLGNLGIRPDIGVAVKSLLCGYVELKAPGKGARASRFTGADKKQWEKFKALPNFAIHRRLGVGALSVRRIAGRGGAIWRHHR